MDQYVRREEVRGKLRKLLLLAMTVCLLGVSRNAFAAASWGEAVTEGWSYVLEDGYHSGAVTVQVKNAIYTGKKWNRP